MLGSMYSRKFLKALSAGISHCEQQSFQMFHSRNLQNRLRVFFLVGLYFFKLLIHQGLSQQKQQSQESTGILNSFFYSISFFYWLILLMQWERGPPPSLLLTSKGNLIGSERDFTCLRELLYTLDAFYSLLLYQMVRKVVSVVSSIEVFPDNPNRLFTIEKGATGWLKLEKMLASLSSNKSMFSITTTTFSPWFTRYSASFTTLQARKSDPADSSVQVKAIQSPCKDFSFKHSFLFKLKQITLQLILRRSQIVENRNSDLPVFLPPSSTLKSPSQMGQQRSTKGSKMGIFQDLEVVTLRFPLLKFQYSIGSSSLSSLMGASSTPQMFLKCRGEEKEEA